MDNQFKILEDFKPEKEFFIGIDSDGCVFDTMEIKQKEAFCPMFIKHFNLQKVSKFARETWEFVNLYSVSRGANRFKALIKTLELLEKRPEVIARNQKFLDMTPLIEWINVENKLGNPALKKYAAEKNRALINLVLEWSVEVNKQIEDIVFDVPPFQYVSESLIKMQELADLMVVSQTPTEALVREWKEHNIDKYPKLIAGQELGTKTEHLKYGAKNKYSDDRILMIGDAPGDLAAARSNGVLFYPVNPGHEEESWRRFFEEGIDKFKSGSFKGKYEDELIREFTSLLPEIPSWKGL
jgi:phosphoglycolate phosphatase-like HAD superfamily hydrolase